MFTGQFEVLTKSGLDLIVHRTWWMAFCERARVFDCKVIQVKQGDPTLVGKTIAISVHEVKYCVKL